MTLKRYPSASGAAFGKMGARNLVLRTQEENMYKELYEGTIQRTITDYSVGNDDITTIGSEVFRGTIGVTSVSFPNVTIVDNYNFMGVNTLKRVYLPKVTSTGGYFCTNCARLEHITVYSLFLPSGYKPNRFYAIGRSTDTKTDAYGNQYKCLIEVLGMTASEMRSWATSNGIGESQDLIVCHCTDGYVYKDTVNNVWVAERYPSQS